MKTDQRQTAAAALRQDPRVAEARQLLRAALADHQGALTGACPAEPALSDAYAVMLERFGQARGGDLYYPYIGSGFGHGALVELADGSVKYDMISGIGVHYFGHGHLELLDAGLDAALSDTVMQGNLQQDTESVQLVSDLLDLATRGGAKLEHCFLSTSGAMANENALKLAFCHRQPADRVLAFDGCFCGRTLTLAQITDKARYRVGLPQTVAVDYVPFFDAEAPEESTARALEILGQHLSRYPTRHAAMIIELIQGEGGYYPGDRNFFIALMERLREQQVAVIHDEIQTFGRTTRPFAFQHFELDEYVDLVTVGKLSQVCATLYRGEYRPPPGLVSQTFTGSSASIFAARRICRLLDDESLFGRGGHIAGMAGYFVDRLRAIEKRHPAWIRGPYGLGAMIAFTPFDGKPETAKTLAHALFDAGVIAFVAGGAAARIRFLPPMPVLSEEDIDRVVEILEKVLENFSPTVEK